MPATQSLTFGNLEFSVYGMPAVAQRKSTAANRSPCRRKPASDNALLIERLKGGDSDALETIFNTYSKKLYNVALRILGEAADTEEVIQDVFWTVFPQGPIVSRRITILNVALPAHGQRVVEQDPPAQEKQGD